MDGTGGWYPDPQDPARVRWWDGEWTEHVRDPQQASVATLAPAAPYATPESFDEPPGASAALSLSLAPSVAPPPPPPPPAPLAPPEPAPSAALDLATVTPPRPVSSGAALLPPLPGAKPPPSPEAPVAEQKPKKERKPRSPITVVIIVLGIALALFAALWFGGIIKPKDAPVASNPDAQVYEGPGYNIEVPKDWTQSSVEPPRNVDVIFSVPSGAQFAIGSAEGNPTALEGDAELQAAFDTVVRVQRAVYPEVQVVGQEPATLAGAPGQRVTLEGPSPAGTPVRVVELAAVRDGKIIFLVLEGPPDVVAASTPAFDAAVATFAFTD